MIHYIIGNLLEQHYDAIAHQVNCQGVMGSGIAKQIKKEWPYIYKAYKKVVNLVIDKYLLLGYIQPVLIGSMHILNIFSQYDYLPRDMNHTDYKALREGLVKVEHYMLNNKLCSLGIPDHMGCGLAGGDWEGVVLPMIQEIFGDCSFDVYIVKLEK